MPPSIQAHARSHSLLLLQKLLNLRDSSASPLTLILDSLEQPAGPLLREFALRGKFKGTNKAPLQISGSKTILLSFSTIRRPAYVDVLIQARGKDLETLQKLIILHSSSAAGKSGQQQQRTILLLDTLHPLLSFSPTVIPSFLSSILAPTTSCIAVYHSDIPLIPPPSHSHSHNQYHPHPLTVLSHLSTTILRLSSLSHEISRQHARNRSVQDPVFGLLEGREGVLVGLKGRKDDNGSSGFILGMELRRRSGRAVVESFILTPNFVKGQAAPATTASTTIAPSKADLATITLLKDHPEFTTPEPYVPPDEEETPESTFDLGLTEKQRKDREGVVLPYFDAQKDVGGGEGGRILYEMGREDDFDEEEDEI
ncbi:elongator complex protein 5 [Zalerion maritima]|uniref:Elongator complex protein 5 n=1 Tax=Zalerion maritima TaxID=339359 RepID=A0AAD5WUI3_9PEZI|nr:elongator complex protein 5 [Zalerion maritima]